MPLVISGPISMGGSVTGQSINLELTKAATDIISLNDTDARRLALIIEDQTTISLNDFYGKQLITFGQEQYTAPGTYYWVCPEGITSVSVVCIGGGGGFAGRSHTQRWHQRGACAQRVGAFEQPTDAAAS
jgi:hypothetical protein